MENPGKNYGQKSVERQGKSTQDFTNCVTKSSLPSVMN